MTQYFQYDQFESAYGRKIAGLIHVGANEGQELQTYLDAGIRHIKLFEPLKDPFERLLAVIAKINDNSMIEAYNVALGAEEKTSQMFVADNAGASSSLLEPMENQRVWKKIHFDATETVDIAPLSHYRSADDPHNMLLLDVQGYELEVLRGAADMIGGFDYVISELNREKSYKGSAGVADIDQFMTEHGFRRMETYWLSRYWGDALYVRADLIPASKLPIEVDQKKPRGLLKRLIYSILGRV
ncbi:FkbM family methyltransferase [Breoghania sp. L-A4]|uniref:FkbM family methyltransferase n=1 Tax=Breoghania sp. L-A4 TaxID=2304600 RepID=UPI0013C3023B|nr:FkbM family methyltransferase [Breoghania sp. L-A4]